MPCVELRHGASDGLRIGIVGVVQHGLQGGVGSVLCGQLRVYLGEAAPVRICGFDRRGLFVVFRLFLVVLVCNAALPADQGPQRGLDGLYLRFRGDDLYVRVVELFFGVIELLLALGLFLFKLLFAFFYLFAVLGQDGFLADFLLLFGEAVELLKGLFHEAIVFASESVVLRGFLYGKVYRGVVVRPEYAVRGVEDYVQVLVFQRSRAQGLGHVIGGLDYAYYRKLVGDEHVFNV